MKGLLGLAFALAATGAMAQTPDLSQAQDGNFGARLLITDDPESFWTQWNQPGTPYLKTTSTITRGRPIETVIIFHGCMPAADGNCNVTVHYEMTQPDGKPYHEPRDGVAWHHPPFPEPTLMASEADMGFKLDPPDELGAYLITATLRDTISGKTLRLRATITAVDDTSPSLPQT